MKTKFLIILIAFSVNNIFAQTDSLTIHEEFNKLEKKLVEQEEQLQGFYKELDKEYRTYKIIKEQFNDKYSIQQQTIDSLKQIINVNSDNIDKTANEFSVKIDDTHKFTSQSITDLNKTISQNTLYWIIVILVVALLVLLVFILLKKQLFKQKTDLDSNLQETRKVLEEEGVKLDNKLIELLETQLKIINSNSSNTKKEADHTLALKVADEIIRMQTNMELMDQNVKGLKKLRSAVKRIQDNFSSNGYELVEMIGKPYHEGMRVTIVSSKPDDTLKKGEQIITRIIKPQINYNDEMIQSAQIEVSQGE